jgi:NAD(P)-dependent dehydrogenase (short-subunit alcohol dehydrogenase family)
MDDWWGLSGKRVVVVGAGGIGSACVRAFADVGTQIAVIDSSRLSLDALTSAWPRVQTVIANVAEPAAARTAIEAARRSLGGLDVLVHAVGVNLRKPILEFSDDDWDRLMATNLSSAFYCGQAAAKTMTAQRGGRVIFLSSVAGRVAHRNHGPYAASKSGMDQLMRVMAHEWASDNVTVNAIAPGYTETALTSAHLATRGVRAELEALVPAGRLGDVDDLVGPVLFLASERAAFVTGQVLYVDGGRTLV